MSHKWTCEAFAKITQAALVETQRVIALFPHFGSNDNLNIPMFVFLQQLHNQNHFIDASAAMIYVLPLQAKPTDNSRRVLLPHILSLTYTATRSGSMCNSGQCARPLSNPSLFTQISHFLNVRILQ